MANPKELTLVTVASTKQSNRAGGTPYGRKAEKEGKFKKKDPSGAGKKKGSTKAHNSSNKSARRSEETLLAHNQTDSIASTGIGEIISFQEYDNETEEAHGGRPEVWEYGYNRTYYAEETAKKTMTGKRDNWNTLRKLRPPPEPIEMHIPSDGFFCESPSKSIF